MTLDHAASGAVSSVALVTGSLSPLAGGVYFSARIAANIMANRGRSPAVLGLEDEQWDSARETWHVDRIEAVAPSGPAGYFATRPLLARLSALAPDLVHLHGIWGPYSAAAWRWRWRSGRPLIISPHGMVDEGALRISGARKHLVGALYEYSNLRSATALHALNGSEHRAIRALGCRGPIATIPNGVEIQPLERRAASADGKRNLLFLSRLHKKKGVEEMLLAWKMACDIDSTLAVKWSLTIAGWGEGGYVARMRKLAASLGIADGVHFPGSLLGDEKTRAFDASAAFILPSHSEGLPISVLEAWERGLPVLMTDECNLPEGFAAEAALPTTNDPADLARNIVALCELSDEERATIGARGRALACENYDWEGITDQYLALYDWVAGRGERPDFVDVDN